MAGVICITLKHANTKHAQKIVLLDQSHASIKQALEIETGERRSLWHKYVSTAVLNYKHILLLEYWLRTEQSFSWTHSLQYLCFKNGYSSTENSLLRLTGCPRCAWTDGIDFPGRPQKRPCKLISNTKRITRKKPKLHNLNKPITSTYHGQKKITKGAKLSLQIFSGLDHILLKRCYRTMIIWYAKLAPIRPKFFIEWGYANSHPANPYRTYQSHHANGNQTQKLALNVTIYTPEHGSVNMTRQFLIAFTITWQPLVHPKFQDDSNKQLMKWGALREPYQEIPQKLFLVRQTVWLYGHGLRHAAWCECHRRATWPNAYQPPQLKIRPTSKPKAKLHWRLQILTLSHDCLRNVYVEFQEIQGTCYGTDMRRTYMFFSSA